MATLVGCLIVAVPAFSDSGRTLSLPDYVAELHRLQAGVDDLQKDPHSATLLARSVPAQWTVQAEGKNFQIDNNWLKGKLGETEKNPAAVPAELHHHLAALLADAEGFQQPAVDVSRERTKLNEILSRREFHNVHGPSWWDLLKQRIFRFLARLFQQAFGSSSFGEVGRYFVWTLIGIAVVALAYWVFKTIKRNSGIERILPETLPVSAKQWATWMAEAQAAARDGRWRDAVHLAYWAGISFLEEQGMWRPDRARTPREYLRLLAPTSAYCAALSRLTGQFELIWYGYKEAGPESFSETLIYLENLGCRLS